MRRTTPGLGIAVLVSTLVGCGRADTGVHIHARVAALQYDELQFRVTRASGEVVVDPAGAGRYQGPFGAGDQDVLVYLRDDLGGSQLHCEASALQAGAVVASGAGDVTVVRGEMTDLDIAMAAPGGGGAPGGGSGSGGSGGGSPPGKSNGEPCSVGAECVTGFCADGVCCESDCGGACHSCGLPDSPGLCRPVAGGAPDARGKCSDMGPASCGTTGLCGVDGNCAVYAAGTECAPAACIGAKAEMVTPAAFCDGAGKCAEATVMKCGKDATCVAGVCTEVAKPMP